MLHQIRLRLFISSPPGQKRVESVLLVTARLGAISLQRPAEQESAG